MNPASIAVIVVAVVAGLGGVFAYFSQQRGKEVINLQAVEIATQKQRIETLETGSRAKDAALLELQTQVRVLRDEVTHSSKIDLLVTTSEQQHRAIVVSIDSLTSGITGLLNEVRNGKAAT